MAFQTTSPDVLDAILVLSEAINGKEPLEECYPKILDAIQTALQADRISILLADPDGKMRFKAWNNLSSEYRAAVNGHSPWPPDSKNPEPIFVSNCQDDPQYAELHETFRAEGLSALAFLPLCCQGTLAGKFMVYYDKPHIFSDHEISLGKTIARIVGFAVERVRNEEKIRKQLHEKQILLRELHHRVKNNLQMISNVLSLQCLHADDGTRFILDQSQKRLKAMSLIHERLLETDSFEKVDLGSYIRDLSAAIVTSYESESQNLRLTAEVTSGVWIDANDAVMFGLIVNEILSNALKHAFVGRDAGELFIRLQRVGEGFELIVKDDGNGLPDGFDSHNHNTLGLRIIHILAEQLRGKIFLDRSRGTSFRLQFHTPAAS